jgi:hypothetical protein
MIDAIFDHMASRGHPPHPPLSPQLGERVEKGWRGIAPDGRPPRAGVPGAYPDPRIPRIPRIKSGVGAGAGEGARGYLGS